MRYETFVSTETRSLILRERLDLEGGGRLERVQVAFRSWGKLNAAGDNAVLVCHALTGSADVDDLVEGLLGPGRALDPEVDFVVATNVLGGCYGTTGPSSPAAVTGPELRTGLPRPSPSGTRSGSRPSF